MGNNSAKVVICDRFHAHDWVESKPWCWAHLRRDLRAMIDRDNGGLLAGGRS